MISPTVSARKEQRKEYKSITEKHKNSIKMDKITISQQELERLRGHLDSIEEILKAHTGHNGIKKTRRAPRETKADKIKKYMNLIGTGSRVKKPNHLKK